VLLKIQAEYLETIKELRRENDVLKRKGEMYCAVYDFQYSSSVFCGTLKECLRDKYVTLIRAAESEGLKFIPGAPGPCGEDAIYGYRTWLDSFEVLFQDEGNYINIVEADARQ
jgi:hypothetical protein